jgi:hypothetical protein
MANVGMQIVSSQADLAWMLAAGTTTTVPLR